MVPIMMENLLIFKFPGLHIFARFSVFVARDYFLTKHISENSQTEVIHVDWFNVTSG